MLPANDEALVTGLRSCYCDETGTLFSIPYRRAEETGAQYRLRIVRTATEIMCGRGFSCPAERQEYGGLLMLVGMRMEEEL